MPLNNCICGLPVRLGGARITFNRKRGVAHYIDHQGQTSCQRTKEFTCAMMKPYPKKDEDKEWFKMIERWNKENPAARAA